MSNNPTAARRGGHLLIESLITHGADLAFGIPGESYLAAMDGMYEHRDRFSFVVCRQEGGAAYMADAYGKLTGRPGICFVTRGPGATNASIGVHTAFQDSTPLILFIGQVARGMQDREAFQEIDYRRMFGQMAKWVAQIESADRIPEYVARAFQTATSGRQGPVVLALPEDMLEDFTAAQLLAPYRRNLAWPEPLRMSELATALGKARRPLMLLGGSGWTPAACASLETFASRWNLPTACAFRFQDLFDNRHPQYAGEVGSSMSAGLKQRIEDADLIVAVGLRLGEGTTRGYTLLKPPRTRQTLVHVHPGAEELGSVYQADLMIQASPTGFAAALAELHPVGTPVWGQWSSDAAADYAQHVTLPKKATLPLDMAQVVRTLQDAVPADTIYASGAGNYAGWFNRYLRYPGFSSGRRSQLAPSNGSMGYGIPAGVAAKLANPDQTVIAVAGDGCFQMNGLEIGTAMQYGARVVFIVINNGVYGTIRMHQEMYFPGRPCGTELVNPDFAALARAYGMTAHTVRETAGFLPALQSCLACDGPSLIEIQLDVEIISTNTTVQAIRQQVALSAAGR